MTVGNVDERRDRSQLVRSYYHCYYYCYYYYYHYATTTLLLRSTNYHQRRVWQKTTDRCIAMEVPLTEERFCVLQNRVYVLYVFVNTIDLLLYLLRYRKQVTVQI